MSTATAIEDKYNEFFRISKEEAGDYVDTFAQGCGLRDWALYCNHPRSSYSTLPFGFMWDKYEQIYGSVD